MDISVNPVSGAASQLPLPSTYPAATTDSTPAATVSTTANAGAQAAVIAKPNVPVVNDAALHEQAIQQASQAAPFNYPLGDKEFTIFKDNTGQYITRYVSLRDGSITYIPEPSLVRHTLAVLPNANNPALIALHA